MLETFSTKFQKEISCQAMKTKPVNEIEDEEFSRYVDEKCKEKFVAD